MPSMKKNKNTPSHTHTLSYSLNTCTKSLLVLNTPHPPQEKSKAPHWQISVVVPASRFDLTHSVAKKNTVLTPMRLCGKSLPVFMTEIIISGLYTTNTLIIPHIGVTQEQQTVTVTEWLCS